MSSVKKTSVTKPKKQRGGGSKKFTTQVRERFLGLLRENGGIIGDACADVGFSRVAVHKVRRKDLEFNTAMEKAQLDGIEVLEDEAIKRALDGTEEPIYYMGEVVGTVHRKSDACMKMILQANKAKYKSRTELSGPDGKPLSTGGVTIYLPDNERDKPKDPQ